MDDLIPHIRPRVSALRGVGDDCIKLRRHITDQDLPEDIPIEALYNSKEDTWVVVAEEFGKPFLLSRGCARGKFRSH